MNPFVSIIVPIYNIESYLFHCIDSILESQFIEFELILIDDGSPDRCGEICDTYSSKHSNITTLHKPNGGVSSARNCGLEIARGRWIWFVDGDDMVEKGALQTLRDNTIEGCDLVQFSISKLDGDRVEILATNSVSKLESNQFLESYPSYHNQRMLFRRDIIEQHRLRFTQGVRLGEDLEFQIKYLLHISRPIEIPYNLYIYRIRGGSAVNSPHTNQYIIEDSIKILWGWLQHLKSHNIAIEEWLNRRLSRFLKTLLLAAQRGGADNKKELQRELRKIIKSYRAYGAKGFNSPTIRLAEWSIGAYIIALKLYIKHYRGVLISP